MSKDHFYFNRNDRIVAMVLLAIIIAAIIIRMPGSRPVSDSGLQADTVVQRVETKDSVRAVTHRSEKSRSTAGNRTRTSSYTGKTTERANYRRDTVSRITYKDTLRNYRYAQKEKPSSPIDLNAADSVALVKLPGIGPVFASRITAYRNQLGGFTSTHQLTEIKGLPDSLMEWFIIGDSVPIEKIEVNKKTLNELRRHPYINFYQARAIVELRKERGNIKGPGQLSLLEEFTAQDLERLEPYLDFR